MRNPFLLLFLLLLLFVVGCTTDDETPPKPLETQVPTISNILGKWQLVKYIAGWTNTVVPVKPGDVQQYYEFNADSTFRFYRTDDTLATGKFTIKKLNNMESLQVTYQPADTAPLHFNPVYLSQTNTGFLVESHLAVDGPAHFYQKVAESGTH